MSSWQEGFEKLPPECQANVQRWIHLNTFIARTLHIPEEKWFEEYIGDAMRHPFDYSFMQDAIPGFSSDDAKLEKPAQVIGGFTGTEVPLRADNNLGRLSPELQDTIASMIEAFEPDSVKVTPADVAHLQKIFSRVAPVAKLKRPLFRKIVLACDPTTQDFILSVEDGDELMRMNVIEFTTMMTRKLH